VDLNVGLSGGQQVNIVRASKSSSDRDMRLHHESIRIQNELKVVNQIMSREFSQTIVFASYATMPLLADAVYY